VKNGFRSGALEGRIPGMGHELFLGRKDCTGLLVRFVWSSGVPQHDGGVAASMEQLIRAGLWPKD